MRWPLDNFTITQRFGDNPGIYGPGGHTGIDLAAPKGTPIKSPVAGTVIAVNNDPGYVGGRYSIIRQDASPNYEHYMGHQNTVGVSPGQRVQEGDVIGTVGMTGSATGPHVHYQIRQRGGGPLVNPENLIKNGDDMADKVTAEDLPDMVRGYLFREPVPADNVHIGKTWAQAQYDFIHSPQRAAAWAKYNNFPTQQEVEQAFNDLQPWLPINTPPYTDQTEFYMNHSRDVLYQDLATGVKKKLDAASTPPSTGVSKEDVLAYIQEHLS